MKEQLKAGADRAANAMARRILSRGTRDITERTSRQSCLVLAPHPDDETLGCGGTIMRKAAAGTPVHIAFATDGRYSHPSSAMAGEELARLRQREAIAACGILGVEEEHLSFLGFEDGRLSQHQPALQEALLQLIRRIQPSEILVTSELDWHTDHQILNRAVTELAQCGRITAEIRDYPVWFWSARAWLGHARPRPASLIHVPRHVVRLCRLRPLVVRTAGLLPRKRQALDAYESQMRQQTATHAWATLEEAFLANFFRDYEIFFRQGL